MADKLRAGVIGIGILGNIHADFYQGNEDVELVGVSDLMLERAEAKAAETGAKAYKSYEEMFKAENLDVVSVATPDPFHKEPFVAAIKAGIPNIITEKPLATNVPDAEEMMDAAHKAGTKVFINFSNRGIGADRATRYVYEKGLIGDLIFGKVLIDDNINVPTEMWGDRSKEWAGGSSTAHFLLSHGVDLMRFYFSPAEITNVYAISQQKVLGYTPDLYDAFLTFDNGAVIEMEAGWIRHMDELVEFSMNFTGTKGGIVFNKLPSFGTKWGWRANVSDELVPQDMLKHQEALADNYGVKANVLLHKPSPTTVMLSVGGGDLKRSFEVWEADMDWHRSLRTFIRAIIEDTLEPSNWQNSGPVPTGDDGLIQTRIVAAIVESSETGKEISL